MTEITIFRCDVCEVEARIDLEDMYVLGWRQNVDGDDFCPKCALSLDPPENDDD
jgi:hypothetical protein